MSGFFLAWYYIPEPGLVIELREEMFNDTRFGAEVFYMHLRGVDSIFLLSYMHIFKKIYLKNYVTAESDGWMLGGYSFFILTVVVFFGISLSATHLSDLTLTIGANIVASIFNFVHKSYYFIFTNKHLNTDQMTRLMVLHYFIPWYYIYLVKMHVLFVHEGWDSDSGENVYEDKTGSYISYFYDGMLKELQDAWYWVLYIFLYFWMHHFVPGTVNYFFFERWNISELDEIRFYAVAPHWYFRPMMGCLTISPTHYEGLSWFGLWLTLLAILPIVNHFYNSSQTYLPIIPMQSSLLQTSAFILFMFSVFTVNSMLPVGRYYYEPEGGYVGNPWVKFSGQYLYLYLGWILHNLDLVEHYAYSFANTYNKKYNTLSTRSYLKSKSSIQTYNQINDTKLTTSIKFENKNYNLKI
jgi:quinol-cytochrome oxidoreductase complex cytochrome b subunit